MEDYHKQIKEILRHNVPRFIQHIVNNGGVSKDEWQWLKDNADSNIYVNADSYLVCPTSHDKFVEGIKTLILTLAIMSFVPYGVTFMGITFDSTLPNFLEDET